MGRAVALVRRAACSPRGKRVHAGPAAVGPSQRLLPGTITTIMEHYAAADVSDPTFSSPGRHAMVKLLAAAGFGGAGYLSSQPVNADDLPTGISMEMPNGDFVTVDSAGEWNVASQPLLPDGPAPVPPAAPGLPVSRVLSRVAKGFKSAFVPSRSDVATTIGRTAGHYIRRRAWREARDYAYGRGRWKLPSPPKSHKKNYRRRSYQDRYYRNLEYKMAMLRRMYRPRRFRRGYRVPLKFGRRGRPYRTYPRRSFARLRRY